MWTFPWKLDVKLMLMGHRAKDPRLCEMDRSDETVLLRTLQPASTTLTVLKIVKNQTGHIVNRKQVEVVSAYLSQMIHMRKRGGEQRPPAMLHNCR